MAFLSLATTSFSSSPLVGEGGTRTRGARFVAGRGGSASTLPRIRRPSSGASRHLSPQGEKRKKVPISATAAIIRAMSCGRDRRSLSPSWIMVSARVVDEQPVRQRESVLPPARRDPARPAGCEPGGSDLDGHCRAAIVLWAPSSINAQGDQIGLAIFRRPQPDALCSRSPVSLRRTTARHQLLGEVDAPARSAPVRPATRGFPAFSSSRAKSRPSSRRLRSRSRFVGRIETARTHRDALFQPRRWCRRRTCRRFAIADDRIGRRRARVRRPMRPAPAPWCPSCPN